MLQLTMYSIVALIFCLLTWFNVWTHADILRVANRPELIMSTLASAMGIFTSLLGWAGILLNNRTFLAIYTFLLWIVFALLVTPGYITYRKQAFALEGKLNQMWSQALGGSGRARVQHALGCCGYFSPFVEASISQTCYARSVLDGCKNEFLKFERFVLKRWFVAAFAIVPVHIFVMLSGLLCSNHVTYRFGKGMMPKAYRLSMNSMAVIMDNYAKWVLSIVTDFECTLTMVLLLAANSQSNTARMSHRRRWPGRGRTSSWIRCPRFRTNRHFPFFLTVATLYVIAFIHTPCLLSRSAIVVNVPTLCGTHPPTDIELIGYQLSLLVYSIVFEIYHLHFPSSFCVLGSTWSPLRSLPTSSCPSSPLACRSP
jgi:hypothetical protein